MQLPDPPSAGPRRRIAAARLQVLVTRALCTCTPEIVVRAAAAGGADVIQVREKDLRGDALEGWVRKVRGWCAGFPVLLVVNDDAEMARNAEADGVHVGQDDLPPAAARAAVGRDRLVGWSTHDLDQLREAARERVDYIGFGPAFDTATKELTGLGLAVVTAAATEAARLRLPLFAIGGIGIAEATALAAAGVRRIAVSSAVCAAADPLAATRALREAICR